MFICVKLLSGEYRIRKKASVRDVYKDSDGITVVSFYGKNLCMLKVAGSVQDFKLKYLGGK